MHYINIHMYIDIRHMKFFLRFTEILPHCKFCFLSQDEVQPHHHYAHSRLVEKGLPMKFLLQALVHKSIFLINTHLSFNSSSFTNSVGDHG